MKKIIYYLVIVLVIFATLDGVRDTFLKDNPLSYIKEFFSILLFLLLTLVTYKKKLKLSNSTIVIFNVFFLILLMISTLTTKFADATSLRGYLSFGGWSVWVKFLSLYCLINSLYFLRLNYPDIFHKIPKWYVLFVVLYCLITLFFILTGLSASLESRNWSGRLSIGYPTLDSLVLVVAFIFALVFIKRKTVKISVMILFMVVLMMQNTASGYIMMVIFVTLNSVVLKGFYKFIPPLLAIPMSYIGYKIYTSWYLYMGGFGILFVDKINGFIFGSDTSSIDLRKNQIDVLLSDMNNYIIYTLFGKGGLEAYLVESTYYAFYGFCGLLGVILLVSSLLFFLFKLPKSFKNRTYYYHGFFITIMFIISSAGLIGFYLYPMIFIYAYLVSIYSFPENYDSKEFYSQ